MFANQSTDQDQRYYDIPVSHNMYDTTVDSFKLFLDVQAGFSLINLYRIGTPATAEALANFSPYQ